MWERYNGTAEGCGLHMMCARLAGHGVYDFEPEKQSANLLLGR
jgi:hypothetical protein